MTFTEPSLFTLVLLREGNSCDEMDILRDNAKLRCVNLDLKVELKIISAQRSSNNGKN